jgi:folate-binding protein YgfZ
VEVVGKDRQRILHNLCTNDIAQLGVGGGCEAFFLDAKGKILDYAVVCQLSDATWLDVEPGGAPGIIKHLDRYVIREDVRFHDRTASHFQWALVGPKAKDILLAAGAPEEALAVDGGSPRVSIVELAGQAIQLRHRGGQAYPGYEIVAPRESAEAVAKKLVEVDGPVGLVRVGAEAVEILRIEAGLPTMGREITSENLAQEIGRDLQAISFKKGCYLGQETVARLDALGHVNKLLRGVLLAPGAAPKADAVVKMGEKEVGKLTSWSVSPALGRPIGLAVLRVAACKAGTELSVEVESGNSNAVAMDLPFATA